MVLLIVWQISVLYACWKLHQITASEKKNQCYNVRSFVCIFFFNATCIGERLNPFTTTLKVWTERKIYLLCFANSHHPHPHTHIVTSHISWKRDRACENRVWPVCLVFTWVCVGVCHTDTHAHHRKRAELGLLLHAPQYLHLRLGVCVCVCVFLFVLNVLSNNIAMNIIGPGLNCSWQCSVSSFELMNRKKTNPSRSGEQHFIPGLHFGAVLLRVFFCHANFELRRMSVHKWSS